MNTLAILNMPGGWEWILILVVGLLLFGRKLPELGRSLGKGIVEFKKGLKGVKDELDDVDHEVAAAEKRAELDANRAARLSASSPEKAAPPVNDRGERPSTT